MAQPTVVHPGRRSSAATAANSERRAEIRALAAEIFARKGYQNTTVREIADASGILSGSLIVFGLSASAFAIPGLLGGRRLKMVATVVYDEYLHELNWPLGAAVAGGASGEARAGRVTYAAGGAVR